MGSFPSRKSSGKQPFLKKRGMKRLLKKDLFWGLLLNIFFCPQRSQGCHVCRTKVPRKLSVPKNRNRRKIAAFSNRKVLNRRFCRRNRRKIARKSQKKSQKKSLAIFLGRGIRNRSVSVVFKSQRFGTLSPKSARISKRNVVRK